MTGTETESRGWRRCFFFQSPLSGAMLWPGGMPGAGSQNPRSFLHVSSDFASDSSWHPRCAWPGPWDPEAQGQTWSHPPVPSLPLHPLGVQGSGLSPVQVNMAGGEPSSQESRSDPTDRTASSELRATLIPGGCLSLHPFSHVILLSTLPGRQINQKKKKNLY